METGNYPVLEAANLTMQYEKGVTALDHVNFAVHAGEIFTILGANGAGKTTTINLFLNFIDPTEGEARIDGIASHKEPLKAKKKIAFVSENVMLYNNFTAIQNLDYFTKLGGKEDVTKEQYVNVLRRVGLQEEAHNKKMKEFSKGMKQKCGIAIAILKDAPAILLDEPTSGLDPKAAYEFINLLNELRNEGRTILMSTHDIFRAKEVSDSVGIMKQGRLILKAGADELADKDLESLYLEYMAGSADYNS